MNKLLDRLILTFLFFTVLFVLFSIFDYPGKSLFRVIGLGGLSLTYLIKPLIDSDKPTILKGLYVSISLIAFTLFCKYYFWSFWDIPALLAVPLFVVIFTLSLKKRKLTLHHLTSIITLVLIIPLFLVSFNDTTRQYIPVRWYDRMYDIDPAISIKLKDDIKLPESKSMAIEANQLRNKKSYSLAIKKYQEALSLDSMSTKIMFELAECYANTNKLEKGIILLTKAISIENSPVFISQRGFYHYKIGNNEIAVDDLKQAIKLDETKYFYHVNLALALHSLNRYDESCLEMGIAFKQNPNIKKNETVTRIKNKVCE